MKTLDSCDAFNMCLELTETISIHLYSSLVFIKELINGLINKL
jgi:hypothetical protein